MHAQKAVLFILLGIAMAAAFVGILFAAGVFTLPPKEGTPPDDEPPDDIPPDDEPPPATVVAAGVTYSLYDSGQVFQTSVREGQTYKVQLHVENKSMAGSTPASAFLSAKIEPWPAGTKTSVPGSDYMPNQVKIVDFFWTVPPSGHAGMLANLEAMVFDVNGVKVASQYKGDILINPA